MAHLQRVSTSISLLSLALVLSCLCDFTFAGDFRPQNPAPATRVKEISFKLYQGYLIVLDGRMGNLEHQNLLFDTGTNPSIVDRNVSAKLGLHGTPRPLTLFNKNVSSESVVLSEIQVGPVLRQNVPVMISELAGISSGLKIRIDAVIGLDVLGATNFTVDYEKHRFLFGVSTESHVAPFTTGAQFITMSLKTGGHPLHLLLDTGTPQLVLFQSRLHDVDYVWTPVTGSGRNISGTIYYGMVILPQASIGKLEVGPQRASVVANQQGAESGFDGLIGISCLRAKRISFDFERQMFGWSD